MKKIFLNIFIVCSGIVLFSCNNSGKKKDAPDTAKQATDGPITIDTADTNCETIGNFLVSQGWAQDRIDRFKKYQGDAPRGLTNSFWIDSCVIASFNNFLRDHEVENYDGVRFYSFAENEFADIVMVPTKDGGNNHHLPQWGPKVTLVRRCENREFKNFNKEFSEMDDKLTEFRMEYRNEKAPFESEVMDSLSSGIWFSSCVIKSLMKYLGDGSLRLDGVRIYCIAYDKKYTNTFQKYDQQSSFVIVVTERGGPGGHRDRWDVLEKIFRDDKKFKDGGYNHGQLCPTSCD